MRMVRKTDGGRPAAQKARMRAAYRALRTILTVARQPRDEKKKKKTPSFFSPFS